MSCVQITACRPSINVTNISPSWSLPSILCISLTHTNRAPMTSLRLATNASTYQRCMPVCLFGSKGKSENESEASPWKALEKAMGSFKKNNSLEDVLKQQIEKQEYYDDGGSGGIPPLGGGDGSGGSEDEGFAGILDETLQVILATIGFIFLYIYIINGEEMVRLAKDFIKYLFGAKKSVRLRRSMYKWGRFYKMVTGKPEVQKDWLERAIINTPTWYDSPTKYRHILRSYVASASSE